MIIIIKYNKHVQYHKSVFLKSLLNGLPYVSYVTTCLTCPRALRAHVPKYNLQTGKLKISVFMKSNEGLFTDVFKGAEF